MKRVGICALGFLLIAGPARAASWAFFSFATTPPNAPKVVAAADALLASDVGTKFPGKLLLQAFTANGTDPATHAFVPLYRSAAEREIFVQELQKSAAWTDFQKKMTELGEPVSQVLFHTVKSWGEIVETDHVWIAYSFRVTDPAAFVAAADTFIASPTGKKFPGQVHLSSIVAGGLSPVTHLVSVGFASEAEMESWTAVRDPSKDWATYIAASRKAAEYLGASMARDVKSWGPATLEKLTAP